jgi:hypothetical protein
MSTLRNNILAAIETVLATATADVHPDYEMVGTNVSAGIIYGEWTDDSETNNLLDKHSLSIPMGFFARGPTARADADALQDEVQGLLMADPSFGGLVRRFKPGPVRGRMDGTGNRTALVSQTFTAEFFTEAGSQTAAA